MSTTSPTLVFIAGSWHQGRCFERVTTVLESKHALKCISITLPSTTGNQNADFKGDVDEARRVIISETSYGRNVVVVAHSFGGMVGNSAIKDLTSPPKTSSQGYVIGLILIASGFTLTGLSFMAPMFNIPPPSWMINAETGFADLLMDPREFFYHDLPSDDAEYWTSQLGSQSLKAMFEGGEYAYAGWRDVPTWYIGTIEDRGLPVVVQRVQVGMARAMGGRVVHRELPSSHSPFLSMPEDCVAIILEAVAEFSSEQSGDASRREILGKRAIPPAVRILSPGSWFRYGIPFGIGRFVGTCIGIYGWLRRSLIPRQP